MKQIARLRAERGWSQQRLAAESGLSQSVITRFERGVRDPKKWHLDKIAAAFGMSAAELLAEPEQDSHFEASLTRPLLPHRIPIVGYLVPGGEIRFLTEGRPQEMVEVPGATPGMEALLVQGDVMPPSYYDRDIIGYRRGAADPRDLIGSECVTHLRDGRTFVRTLMPGSRPDTYSLTTYGNSLPQISEVQVEWAALIELRYRKRRAPPHT
ncbi:helix-turn-helix domain-containing protein [Inquilinus limosus]|uniref:helix-turn-helix domain-containing protein n=1 Tax=Inquilinus limosus TaxID=171674 RepID=UPI0009DE0963